MNLFLESMAHWSQMIAHWMRIGGREYAECQAGWSLARAKGTQRRVLLTAWGK